MLLLQAIVHDCVYSLARYVGHGQHVSDVLVGSKLPFEDDLRGRLREHNGDRVPISPRGYAAVPEARDRVLGIIQASGYNPLEAVPPVALEGVPHS